jgi:hypothetical protein
MNTYLAEARPDDLHRIFIPVLPGRWWLGVWTISLISFENSANLLISRLERIARAALKQVATFGSLGL